MAKVRIKFGYYGHRPHKARSPVPVGPGETVNVSDDEAIRLISLGVAELVDAQSSVSPLCAPYEQPQSGEEYVDTSGAEPLPEPDEDADTANVGHLDADQLMSLTKAKLLELASDIGADVSAADSKAKIVDAIIQVQLEPGDSIPPAVVAEAPVI